MTETADRETTAPVVRTVHVRCAPERAFALFTDRITDWWPLQRHGLYKDQTLGVWFESERVVEKSASGEEGVWAEVLEWSPPGKLAMSWHPGTPPEEATVVEVEFVADADGTRVVLTHHGLGAAGRPGGRGTRNLRPGLAVGAGGLRRSHAEQAD